MPTRDVFVLRNAFRVAPRELRYLRARGKGGWCVFNPDDLRVQRPLRATHGVVRRVLDTLRDRSVLDRRRLFGGAFVMHSFPGCRRQAWHYDYDPKSVFRRKHQPLGVIAAIDTTTTWFCTPTRTIELQQGDILCFRADVVHAGAAYEHENTRIHMYLDLRHKRLRPSNAIHLVRDPTE